MLPQIEILMIAIFTSMACALLGVFLVLRGMAMMSDAISHTILLGIVLAFFITKDLNSPLLIFGATATGLLTVYLVESLQKTKLLAEDSSIGTIFPLLFSIGIILISIYAGNVHLDIDAVLLGELAFAPFDRLVVNGMDMGAKSIYVMGGIFLINLVYVVVFYKELKLVTFDSLLAASMGIFPTLMHYSLMTLVSVTTVGAFNAVGAILVVALMIVPASTAFFLVEDLKNMLIFSSVMGAFSAILGFLFAFYLDISIAGSMAVMSGILFAFVFILSPKKGLIVLTKKRKKQKYEFAQMSLLLFLLNSREYKYNESGLEKEFIAEHFSWDKSFLDKVIGLSLKENFIYYENRKLKINKKSIEFLNRSRLDFGLFDFIFK